MASCRCCVPGCHQTMGVLCTCAGYPDPSANRERGAIFCSLITGNLLRAVEALRWTWVNQKWAGFMMCLPAFLPWYKYRSKRAHTLSLTPSNMADPQLGLIMAPYSSHSFSRPPLPHPPVALSGSLMLIRNVTYWLGSLLQIYVAQVLSLKLNRASISPQSYKHGLYHTQLIKVWAIYILQLVGNLIKNPVLTFLNVILKCSFLSSALAYLLCACAFRNTWLGL